MTSLLELLKKKKQDIQASRKGRTVKIPDGQSRWRIMGSWRAGDPTFWHDFGQHFVKNAAGVMQAAYICTDKTFGRPCAVCEAISGALKHDHDEETKKALTEARAGMRVLVNAIQLEGEKAGEVQILELPATAFEAVVQIMTEWAEAGETVLGSAGKDMLFNRTGSGIGTKYTVQVAPRSVAVPAALDAKVNNLDEYVMQESSEQQARALNGIRAVAGLLPMSATAGAAGLPLAARSSAMLIDDTPKGVPVSAPAAAAPARTVAETAAFDDVPDFDAPAAAPAATPVSAPKAAAPVAAPVAAPAVTPPVDTGDDELNALLADLGA